MLAAPWISIGITAEKINSKLLNINRNNSCACSRIDTQTQGLGLDLTFDLLNSGSVHAEVLPCTTCLLTLVMKAQAVFI